MSRHSLTTGDGTAAQRDVADPHPATEEHYDTIPRPGGTKPPKGSESRTNSYAHDSKAPKRPKNRGAGPQ